MTNYVYIRSDPGLYTVGFYAPDGKWHPESDYNKTDQAAERVRCLNGDGSDGRLIPRLLRENAAMREALKRALPWLGKALAEEIHVGTAMPKDLLATLEQAKAALAQVEGGKP